MMGIFYYSFYKIASLELHLIFNIIKYPFFGFIARFLNSKIKKEFDHIFMKKQIYQFINLIKNKSIFAFNGHLYGTK